LISRPDRVGSATRIEPMERSLASSGFGRSSVFRAPLPARGRSVYEVNPGNGFVRREGGKARSWPKRAKDSSSSESFHAAVVTSGEERSWTSPGYRMEITLLCTSGGKAGLFKYCRFHAESDQSIAQFGVRQMAFPKVAKNISDCVFGSPFARADCYLLI